MMPTKILVGLVLIPGTLVSGQSNGAATAVAAEDRGSFAERTRDGADVPPGPADAESKTVEPFRPQTRQEAALYQALLELQRELEQLRAELRTLHPAGDRPRQDGDRLKDGTAPRDGERPRDSNAPRDSNRMPADDLPLASEQLLPSAVDADPRLAQLLDSDLPQAAERAIKLAVDFYRGKAASHGGYVYYYSLDLRRRWGEGKPGPDTIFVQPPGTPTVGMAYLEAYAATGDGYYLDAAREAADALVAGQLESGGWTQVIHFGAAQRLGKYRKRPVGSWNVSSLDDGQTQAALQMLIRADQALKFQRAEIHESARYGLDALLGAQFANGAFPQGWREPVPPQPVLPARFPDYDWRVEGRIKNYWDYYTLNDNVAGTVAETLILAHEVYRDDRYLDALQRLGGFLILAQMPNPQPGWCQQYNYETVPIWARKFEPPAITGWESQDIMETLIKIARYTGDRKYLEPIPRALAYFCSSLLPDGNIARYYELKTNQPLYMDARYQLTYDDSAVPKHYGWKQPARLDSIERAFLAAQQNVQPATVSPAIEQEQHVRAVIRALDADGRWVTTHAGERLVGQPEFRDGFHYLSSDVFSRNVAALSAYVSQVRPNTGDAP